MNDPEIRRIAIKHLDSLIPHELGWSSTVSLVLVRNDSLHQFGTGTLFRIADESFVITATHVIEDAKKEDLHICPGNGKIVPLRGKYILGDRESIDVAVIHLAGKVVEHLEGRTFLRTYHVSLGCDLSNAMFTLFGYPEIWARDEGGKFSRKGFHFTSYTFTGDPSAFGNYEPRENLLLEGAIAEASDRDGNPLEFCYRDGVPAPFPRELKGISGCSVWKIADTGSAIHMRGSQNARLVAIQTGIYHRSECIKATRWDVAATLIYEEFPELRPAMDIEQPT